MAYGCVGCRKDLPSLNGLRQHENQCKDYRDMVASSADSARSRRERRKRKQEIVEETRNHKKARLNNSSGDIPLHPTSTQAVWPAQQNPVLLASPHSDLPSLSLPALPLPQPSSPPPPALPPPAVRPSGLPDRKRRLPARFRHDDTLPESAPAILAPSNTDNAPSTSRLPCVRLIVRDTIRTICNTFGLFREYQHRPTQDPDLSVPIDDLANYHDCGCSADQTEVQSEKREKPKDESPPWPFKSMAVHQYMTWLVTGSSAKTYTEADRLARIISSPGFDANDLVGFSAKRESARLDGAKSEQKAKSFVNSFKQASVDIEVPSGQKGVPPEKFTVHGLHYRDLLETIKSAFSNPLSRNFHLSPFKLFHATEDSDEPTRVYTELYNSDAFIKEHDRVQRAELPPENPNCKLERVVAGLMFWSDATQLANFGDAKLWPIYLFFGSLSKYIRAQPQSGACQHVAYIPSIPDIFHDFGRSVHAKWKTQRDDIVTHCCRELMHAICSLLLTDEFVHAYRYGIVIRCADGVWRRVFPRIFTYSANYPEKYVNVPM
ncbi:hypothetical protein AAF712_012504 [Marasmius tenuissimus]|uniref:Uncharacterized protein n=1 Tax=Marasmius tenuissimus TaxID=585030 RepID=A0ABR2ZHN5_9AGAR